MWDSRARAVLLALSPVLLAAYLLFATGTLRSRLSLRAGGAPGTEQCRPARAVDALRPCARCVHFVTVAALSGRWASGARLAQGLGVAAGALRASQRCFTLQVYTNAARGSSAWLALAAAGGAGVTVRAYPRGLPRNAYSGRSPWLELSRRKLDLLELDARRRGRHSVWTDIDTLVVADLACAYARAPHFVVSRRGPARALQGPRGRSVTIARDRTAYGDLFMLDAGLIAQVRALEAAGMPPPPYDLQDYLSYLLSRCEGAVVDLRALVRSAGFMRGDPGCMGFDFAGGLHPIPGRTRLRVLNGTLQCGMPAPGGVAYRKVDSMSFTAGTFWKMLDAPDEIFKTQELQKWASTIGISFSRSKLSE